MTPSTKSGGPCAVSAVVSAPSFRLQGRDRSPSGPKIQAQPAIKPKFKIKIKNLPRSLRVTSHLVPPKREGGPPLAHSNIPSCCLLLTNKSHHTTGKNNIKPPITRMNTDMKKWARVHSLREWGRVKQKLCKQACKIFAFFCQSQLDGIIRADLRNPWLVLLQTRPARGLLKRSHLILSSSNRVSTKVRG